MQLEQIKLQIPDDSNIILGQAHFMKTVDDLFEALAGSCPGIKFGIAFNEASQELLVRHDGNDPALEEVAVHNAMTLGAGHAFVVLLKEAYPINVMGAIKAIPEVCHVFCATANPIEVITTRTDQGRAILGVVDGGSPQAVEEPRDRERRHSLLKKIGYRP